MFRRKMGRDESKKKFRRGKKTHKRNFRVMKRGGYRL